MVELENNYYLKQHLLNLINFLSSLDNKLIIYGASSILDIILPLIKKKVLFIIDRDTNKIGTTICDIKIISPEMINKINFNKIFISLFGYEDEIKNYLINEFKVKNEKIIIYNPSIHKIKIDSSINKNVQLKNKYKNKRCFILGNAPTIKEIDITLLKDEYVFVMSTFYNHPDFKYLNTPFYTSVKLEGNQNIIKLNWLKTMSENQKQGKDFFFDLKEKEIIEENNLFKGNNIFYIQTSSLCKRSFDIAKITKSYATGVLQVLEIAFYMGFDEIYMHSVNINSICTDNYEYFFDRKLLPNKDPSVNDDNSIKNFLDEFNAFKTTIEELVDFKNYAEKHLLKIYVTNKESMLKIFDFKAFDEIDFQKNSVNTK